MTQSGSSRSTAPAIQVPLQLLLGIVVATVFLLMRVGLVWQAPVGGEELSSLSGAWQATSGNHDGRFIPTLFQALASLLLGIRDTEVLPRILVFAASASIPLAFHLLRPTFGAAAGLIALLLLALDGPAIYTGVAATVSGFDLALLAWAFVLLAREDLRERVPFWAYGGIGFAFAIGGALVLPLVFALAATDSLPAWRNPTRAQIALVAGAAIGIGAASLGFGYGWDGFVVPPIAAFSSTFGGDEMGLASGNVVIIYSWPLLIAGLLGAALLVRDRDSLRHVEWTLLTWTAAGLAWLIAAAGEPTVMPVAALSLPLALLAAPAILAGVESARQADWSVARVAIPVGALLVVVAGAYMADWGRMDRAGDAADVARVVALLSAGIAAFAVAAVEARSRATLVVPALAAGAVVLLVGGFGVGLSSVNEPLPSPVSPESARVLRALALETQGARGGEIVLHPQFGDEIVWPFRDSGDIIIASRVPAEASVVLWPIDTAQPDGFVLVEGDWSLLDWPAAPTADWLQYIRWYVDRNALSASHTRLAVYIRPEQ